MQGLLWDFQSADYSEPPTFSRTGTKYVLNSDGSYEAFATDELAQTDLGVVLEPAMAGVFLRNANHLATWSPDSGLTGASLTGGPMEGLNASRFTRASGNGRIAQSRPVVASTVYRVAVLAKGNATMRYLVVRTNAGDAGATFRNYVFDTTGLAAGFQGGGGANAAISARADGYTLSELDLTAGQTATIALYIYFTNAAPANNSFAAPSATGTWDIAYSDFLTVGTESLIVGDLSAATCGADALTLPLGSPVRDLVFTFDDDSTQTFEDETGDFAVPTNLDRPLVKTAVWGSL